MYTILQKKKKVKDLCLQSLVTEPNNSYRGRQAKPIMYTAGTETDGSNFQLFLSFAYAGVTVI